MATKIRAMMLAWATVAVLLAAAAPAQAACYPMAGIEPPIVPRIVPASFSAIAAVPRYPVRIDFLGHASFEIESPDGARIVTDYNGYLSAARLPHIVTAQALSMRPERVLRRVCDRIGLPWSQKMLDWDDDTDLSSWHVWGRYHVTAASSSGIGPTARQSPSLTGRHAQWASRAAGAFTAIASYGER